MNRRVISNRIFLAALAALALLLPARASDWPTYMLDNARSGYTSAQGWTLSTLNRQWVYTAPAPPTLAWPDPMPGGTESSKVKFDDAFHVVAADIPNVGKTVFFGSSADNKIYALNAVNGAVRWSYFTNGAVRTAPVVYYDTVNEEWRVYAASDDGLVYCLGAANGSLKWTYSTMSPQKNRLGNGRMVSWRPVRGGLAIRDGVVYFGCGSFAQDGIHMVALDADDGSEIWKNTAAGSGRDFTPQGYPVLTANTIISPSARMRPTAFNLSDGTNPVTYANPGNPKGEASGPVVTLFGTKSYVGTQNKLYAYNADAGTRSSGDDWSAAKQVIVTASRFIKREGLLPNGTGTERIRSYSNPGKTLQWTFTQTGLESMVIAGNLVIVGGKNKVYGLDISDGSKIWERDINRRANVDERALGLSVANNQLFVSTDQGDIFCFGNGTPVNPTDPSFTEPFPNDDDYEDAADAIMTKTGFTSTTKGYALVTGSGTAAAIMAYNIAKRTNMQVYCVVANAGQAQTARALLDGALVYGTRVIVDQFDPEGTYPYDRYFANLVIHVSEEDQTVEPSASELLRVLRPAGGWLMYGPVSGATAPDPPQNSRNTWAAAGTADYEYLPGLQGVRTWYIMKRDPLPGAGSWTHQYADPGNSGSTDDLWVLNTATNNLRILWYGAPGPDEAHMKTFRNVAPLSHNGLVFNQSYHVPTERRYILCFDAYNGTRYWEWEAPQGHTGPQRGYQASQVGNMACTDEYLFVVSNTRCYRVDNDSGSTSTTYDIPSGKENTWSYIAVDDTSGLLIGAVKATSGKVSDTLFARNIATGNLVWRYDCDAGDLIYDKTIAVADGRVFFVEAVDGQYDVVALNLNNGSQAWRRADVDLENIIDLDNPADGEDGAMALAKNNVLLLGVVANSYGGKTNANRSVLALCMSDGSNLWASGKTAVGNRKRLLVMGNTLIAWPSAYHLSSGAQKMSGANPWSLGNPGSHCGALSASGSLIFYRDDRTIWYDIFRLAKTTFWNIRPGCWINIVPGGGVVVQPESQYSCTCYYSLQSAMAYRSNAAPNTPPTVSITSPQDQANYATPPASIVINAGASDSDDGDSITRVEFYVNKRWMGEDTSSPYSYTWSSPPVGSHDLTAKAYDNCGGYTTSSVVRITIQSGGQNSPPSVSITDPEDDAVINGSFTICANASDSDGTITKVEFYQGQTKLGEDSTSPYSYYWDAPTPGQYTLTARAYDNEEASTVSAAVNVRVNAPPSVSITSPQDQASFNAPANITITATASDSDGAIAKVEFYEGANKLGEDSTSPYSYQWNDVSQGNYTLTAKAYDDDGGVTTSAAIGISVTGGGGNNPPEVTLTAPDDGTIIVGNSYTLTATASDSDGTITKVEFYEGANKLGEDTSSPYSYNWTSIAAGAYSLTAKAYDNDDASTVSDVAAFTVWNTQDIGSVGTTGSSSYNNDTGVFTVNGAGAGITGTADAFRFTYLTVSGDCTIVAKVTFVSNATNARGGPMIRESLDAGSKQMSLLYRRDTPRWYTHYRTTTNGSTSAPYVSAGSLPLWAKIVRSGNTFTTYYSSNGTSWTQHQSQSITMNSTVYIGLAMTSYNTGTTRQLQCSDVTVTED